MKMQWDLSPDWFHEDLTLWGIIDRLQRRLERQGMTPASADRALSIALRQLVATK